MSDLAQLADAIVAELNAGPAFDPTIVAVRKSVPVIELSKMADGIFVSVIPRSITVAGGTRAGALVDLTVDIGVQRRVDPADDAAIDEMLGLVQAIGERLYNRRLAGLPGANYVSATNEPAIAADHLERFKVFTSVLSVTYRAMRI
ncbi:MAG: hypothetical protein IBJ10_02220 [Phycisphaerales bacterium]|nr:hypothetical protein [Phycisphaerales bacterium]